MNRSLLHNITVAILDVNITNIVRTLLT
jgi:hypothetical protein